MKQISKPTRIILAIFGLLLIGVFYRSRQPALSADMIPEHEHAAFLAALVNRDDSKIRSLVSPQAYREFNSLSKMESGVPSTLYQFGLDHGVSPNATLWECLGAWAKVAQTQSCEWRKSYKRPMTFDRGDVCSHYENGDLDISIYYEKTRAHGWQIVGIMMPLTK